MSYTLKPENESAHGHSAGYLTPQPISLRRVSLAASLGAVVIVSMAGLPSLLRERERRLPSDGLSHVLEPACHGDLQRAFADLIHPADAPPQPRPDYPALDALFARLAPIGHWSRAALFAVDASAEELQAAGLDSAARSSVTQDPGLDGSTPACGASLSWTLVLLDEAGGSLGQVDLAVPALRASRCGLPAADPVLAHPLLAQHLPDWPRVAVFNRPGAGAQSDG